MLWVGTRETTFLWVSWIPRCSQPGLVDKMHRNQTKKTSLLQMLRELLIKTRIKIRMDIRSNT